MSGCEKEESTCEFDTKLVLVIRYDCCLSMLEFFSLCLLRCCDQQIVGFTLCDPI